MNVLAWGLYDFRDGYLDSGSFDNAFRVLKWGIGQFLFFHAAQLHDVDRVYQHEKCVKQIELKQIQTKCGLQCFETKLYKERHDDINNSAPYQAVAITTIWFKQILIFQHKSL